MSAVDAPVYVPEFGFLPTKAARLQQILHDYNPYIELVFIPPRERTDEDTHPFALLDKSPWHAPHIIRHITEREMDNPESVLAWLFEGDLSKHGLSDIMARNQAKEAAEKLMKIKREEDERAERQELAEALLTGGTHGKHFYRHNGKTFRR